MARKDEDSDYSLSITLAAYMASSSEWILDTRATYHLCPIKEWFTDFRNLESSAVVMENDQPCRKLGIGTIRLKMFDGMIRELKEVTIEDGTMKFTHGAMVILQRVRHHNLFYLKGGTTGEANVIEEHNDTTKLWHVRLGHTREKSLQTLMKQRLLKDKKFWAEAVSYASHLINRLPSAAIGGKTPMEMWSEKHTQDYDSLRIFGCPAYYHVKDGKLDPRARKAIFAGFKGGVKGFKLWDLEDKKFVCSRDVTFNEASMMKVNSTLENDSTMEVTPRVEEKVVSSDVPQNEEIIDDADNDDFIATGRPRREIKKHRWLTNDMVVAYELPVIDDDIPNTFGEALRSIESDQWKLAMEEEMKSLHQNQTWELVKLSKGKKAISNKWVYTKKQRSLNQSTHRYKARLVAKGFAQKEGIDYNEVFSPVVKHTSIRILFALIAEYELELTQLDVKTTFLHGDLEEEIYITQPCGFKVTGKENHTRPDISQAVSMVSRYMHNPAKNHWLAVKWILRYLYGTIDVGLLFKKDCGQQCVGYCDSDFAGDLDKRRSTTDYVLTLGGGPVSWRSILQSTIALSTTEVEYTAVTEAVKEAVWLKCLLGDLGVIQKNIAASAVGSLMYAMVYTRPDISQAVSMDCGQQCVGYCDSDFAGDLDKRRSTTDYVFTLGGGPISWRLIIQLTIALSTTEAEYMAATEAVKEVVWLKGLLKKRDYMARVAYASVVGSLMYAMVCTRPDISQAVSMVSRYMYNPGKNQWLAVKWILRYLYGTVEVGLLFKKDCGQQCVGYCDSDFTGDLNKRRSTTSYVFILGGGPVSWRSILQSTIVLSTTEA
ncbi:hypothetical protein KPL71_021764 [Citrus sinensis]|uniref:Uncharacterized protein n=1 Tax=Citrus sinensis TaxID=2711 RepID=A0ACB8JK64_CITSI|nr:hypothetical protein KPL71_021764 [Citrus sinensis]